MISADKERYVSKWIFRLRICQVHGDIRVSIVQVTCSFYLSKIISLSKAKKLLACSISSVRKHALIFTE